MNRVIIRAPTRYNKWVYIHMLGDETWSYPHAAMFGSDDEARAFLKNVVSPSLKEKYEWSTRPITVPSGPQVFTS